MNTNQDQGQAQQPMTNIKNLDSIELIVSSIKLIESNIDTHYNKLVDLKIVIDLLPRNMSERHEEAFCKIARIFLNS